MHRKYFIPMGLTAILAAPAVANLGEAATTIDRDADFARMIATATDASSNQVTLPPTLQASPDVAAIAESQRAFMIVDAPNVAQLLAEDLVSDRTTPRVATHQSLRAPVFTDAAEATETANGATLWQGEVHVPGAYGTRLYITNMNLPHGAELWVYPADAPERAQGPFMEQGPNGSGDFWTGYTAGEVVRLELITPAGADVGSFEIADAAYFYRDIFADDKGGPDKLGNCHNDVMCYPEWQPLHNATARLIIPIGTFTTTCSGTLLATQENDLTPYVLTATHCVDNQSQAAGTEFVWFFQTSSCDGPNTGTVSSFGSTFLVATPEPELNPSTPFGGSDISLLMVDGALPSGLTWAGWLRANSLPNGTLVATIHHPDGARKKFSRGSAQQHAFDPSDFFHVSWYSGTIEGGTSGSGLYLDGGSGDKMLIGVASHHPQGATCTTNPVGPSGYGKFSRFFTVGSSFLSAGSDDVFDGNRDCAAAAPLTAGTQTNMIVKSVYDDWFAVTLAPNAGASVNLGFFHLNGDIDVEVLSACGGNVVASSTSNNNNEFVTWQNGPQATTYYVRVFLDADTRNEYTLTLDVTSSFATGDLNCDGLVNAGDIDPFVLALIDTAGYITQYPDCDFRLADCDDSGLVNAADIDCFVTAVINGGG